MGIGSILRCGLISALTAGITSAPAHSFQTNNNLKDYIREPLKLTMHVVSANYLASREIPECSSETTIKKGSCTKLVLELRLRFTNVSHKIVKLDKDCMHLVSKLVYDSPLVGPPEPFLPDGMISSRSEGCIYEPEEKLVTIPPGEFVETNIRMKFDVIDKAPAHPPGSLTPGEYSLQITMGTWWETDGQDDEWRAKRKLPGVRIERFVQSQLMPFVVERRPIKRRTFATPPCFRSCSLGQAA